MKTLKTIIKTIIPNKIMIDSLPKRAGNSILLTFDDGPDPELTPRILEQLRKYNARALFFVVGEKIVNFPEILNMIVSHGHTVGNHSFSHPNRILTSVKEYQVEVAKCDVVLQQAMGSAARLVRPPLGMSLATLYISLLLKKRMVMWSAEGGEWGVYKKNSAGEITDRLKQELQPRDIVLLHDNNAKTVTVLDSILPFLTENGVDLFNGIECV